MYSCLTNQSRIQIDKVIDRAFVGEYYRTKVDFFHHSQQIGSFAEPIFNSNFLNFLGFPQSSQSILEMETVFDLNYSFQSIRG